MVLAIKTLSKDGECKRATLIYLWLKLNAPIHEIDKSFWYSKTYSYSILSNNSPFILKTCITKDLKKRLLGFFINTLSWISDCSRQEAALIPSLANLISIVYQ